MTDKMEITKKLEQKYKDHYLILMMEEIKKENVYSIMNFQDYVENMEFMEKQGMNLMT